LDRHVAMRAWASLLRNLAVFIPEKSFFALISRKSELLADAVISSMLLLEASWVATTATASSKGVAHAVAFVVAVPSV